MNLERAEILSCNWIRSAKKSILIQTPYFVPDDSVMDALKIAILTGVDVRIMIPYHADNFIVGYASRYYVKDFIEIGAKVYRYKKGFLHSKVVVIDENYVVLELLILTIEVSI